MPAMPAAARGRWPSWGGRWWRKSKREGFPGEPLELRLFREGAGPAPQAHGVHGRARLSERAQMARAREERGSLAAGAHYRGVEGESTRRRPVEPLAAEDARRHAHHAGIRAALRNHGTRSLGTGGFQ